jgi:pimeloyl-ACP methyl ester carboxylesterase
MRSTTLTTALLSVAISLSAAACGGSTTTDVTAAPSPSTTVAVHSTTEERPHEPVDELVRIDSGRLHLRCVGTGSATVLLLAGWDDGGEGWGAIEPTIAEHSRVCSYARFGTGTSDAPSSTQTFATQASDLEALLDEADEPGPYVVVGHSFGGAEAVTFAASHPDDVVGLMLLDASPTTWPATVCSVPAFAEGCAAMHDLTLQSERVDVFPAFEAVAEITSLGDLPMTVMTAAHRTGPGLTDDELARLDAVWAAGMERWAGLSSSSRIVSVDDTGHHIEIDQPQAVAAELLGLLAVAEA